MKSAEGRMNIARTRLAVLGEPEPGEPADVTEKRAHYQNMLDEAMEELGETQRSSLPYRDND